ncbi:MAG: membrane protein insertase YidC, partial [Pedosphaera parvula]|nr:membrane protein insertase YidC [Pedosphaera parvula]
RKDGAAANQGMATLNANAPDSVLTILGSDAVQGDSEFTLTKTSPGSIRTVQVLGNGLEVTKVFHLSTNHLLTGSVTLKNTSGQPLTLPPHQLVVGTAAASGPKDDPMLTGVYWYNGSKMEEVAEGWFANRSFGCGPSNPRTEYEGGSNNVVWSAATSQFFTLAVIPKTPAPKLQVRQFELPLPKEPTATSKVAPSVYQTAFEYPALTLPPAGESVQEFEFYAGPKEYNTLARIGSRQGNNLDLVMKLNGFFGFFSKLLLLAMNGLHQFGLSYGWAIIAITVIIKVLFWPLTKASTRSMKRMAALQPQMKAIQEKYKDDPQKMNLKTMEFMKEHKVSPLGGCLPMLLQMPVFFGFFFMIRSAIELRGAKFLWAIDLSSSDTIFSIPGLGFPINPMPLIMGVTMLIQARMTPPSPGVDPMQQKIMKYMPLMFMVFLYNYSAGLTLYWTVQNLLTIVQMKLTKNDDPA